MIFRPLLETPVNLDFPLNLIRLGFLRVVFPGGGGGGGNLTHSPLPPSRFRVKELNLISSDEPALSKHAKSMLLELFP